MTLDSMGELPKHLKIETEMHKLEHHLAEVRLNHPRSRFKLIRALLNAHIGRCRLMMLSKFMLSLCEMTKPLIVTELIIYIADMHVDGESRDTSWAYKTGLTYVGLELVSNLLWENLLFMIT